MNVYDSTVFAGYAMADCQAQAGPGNPFGEFIAQTPEGNKDLVTVAKRNTRPVVFDTQTQAAAAVGPRLVVAGDPHP